MAEGDGGLPTFDPGGGGDDGGGDQTGGGEGGAEATAPETEIDRIEPEIGAGAEASDKVRAAEAEARAMELERRVTELEEELASANGMLAAAERRWELERALDAAGAVDTETARVLLERDLIERPDADIGELIDGLRGRKPFLFQRVASADAGSAPRGLSGLMAELRSLESGLGVNEELGALAESARESGDRRTLAAYLAARRGA